MTWGTTNWMPLIHGRRKARPRTSVFLFFRLDVFERKKRFAEVYLLVEKNRVRINYVLTQSQKKKHRYMPPPAPRPARPHPTGAGPRGRSPGGAGAAQTAAAR